MLIPGCLAFFILTSCQSVPDGIPPKGSIIDIGHPVNEKIMTTDEALRDMTTAFASISLVPNPDGKPPTLTITQTAAPESYNIQLGQLTVLLYRELLKTEIYDIDIKGAPDYLLVSAFLPVVSDDADRKNKGEKTFTWQVKLNVRATNETVLDHSVNISVPVKNVKEDTLFVIDSDKMISGKVKK